MEVSVCAPPAVIQLTVRLGGSDSRVPSPPPMAHITFGHILKVEHPEASHSGRTKQYTLGKVLYSRRHRGSSIIYQVPMPFSWKYQSLSEVKAWHKQMTKHKVMGQTQALIESLPFHIILYISYTTGRPRFGSLNLRAIPPFETSANKQNSVRTQGFQFLNTCRECRKGTRLISEQKQQVIVNTVRAANKTCNKLLASPCCFLRKPLKCESRSKKYRSRNFGSLGEVICNNSLHVARLPF